MSAETPIACSLGAGDYLERLKRIRGIGREALIEAEHTGDSVRLVFTDVRGVRTRLRDIVAAERACCPFLDLEIGSDPGGITLTIGAPAEAAPIVRDLIESFGSASS
jgi:hypothetical protein